MSDPNRPLRIVLVAEWLDTRGAVSISIDLARQLQMRGHSVLFLYPGGPRLSEVEETGADVLPYLPPGSVRIGSLIPRRTLLEVRDFRPDLVHALGLGAVPGAAALVRRGEAPLVVTVHGWPREETARLEEGGPLPAKVVAISQTVRESLVNRGGVPWDRVHVVEIGVDLRRIEEQSLDVEKPYDPVAGCVGPLEEWRGYQYFVEAAPAILAENPRARLLVAGDGLEERPLRARIRELGLEDRVLFVGGLASYLPVFAELDVFVYPSLEEGLGQNILMAMASGKPVVATSVGGIYRMVEDGKTGLLVRPRDPVALAGAVNRLLADRALAASMGRAGRRVAEERYSITRVVDETEEIYRAVTA